MDCYYKLRHLFYYKVRHGLLQIATSITKCDDYYKLRQVLQSAMIITNYDITLLRSHVLALLLRNCLWRTFQIWWSNKSGQTLTLIDSMILYGVFNNTQHRYSLNYALLVAKFSIYCSCLHDEKISFGSFLIFLGEKLSIQKEIAFGNNTE